MLFPTAAPDTCRSYNGVFFNWIFFFFFELTFLNPQPPKMCSRVWFVTDRRISQEYPQVQILRALKERCADEDVEFRSLLMDQIVLTISEGQLGKYYPSA